MKSYTSSSFCRVCRQRQKSNLLDCREMTFGSRETFRYHLCDNCGSLSLVTIPQNLGDLYQKYPNLGSSIKRLTLFRHFYFILLLRQKSTISKFIKSIPTSDFALLRLMSLRDYIPNKSISILDVGCGNGEFIEHLTELGFSNVTGIDPYLERSDLDKLFKRDFESENQKYDLITFHHTFEHFSCPKLAIKKIKQTLNPGGTCIIRIPNIGSRAFKIYGPDWEGIHPPYHIFLPSENGMHFLTQEVGLEIIEKRWESPFYLHFYHKNRINNIADFDKEGAKKHFFESKKGPPPNFSKSDVSKAKKEAKIMANKSCSDYICYYIKNN